MAIVLASVLGLAGCSDVPPWASPASWYERLFNPAGAPEPPADTAVASPREEFPEIEPIPAEVPTPVDDADREALVAELTAAAEAARRADSALRQDGEVEVLLLPPEPGPVPAPPAPVAQPAEVLPPLEPDSASAPDRQPSAGDLAAIPEMARPLASGFVGGPQVRLRDGGIGPEEDAAPGIENPELALPALPAPPAMAEADMLTPSPATPMADPEQLLAELEMVMAQPEGLRGAKDGVEAGVVPPPPPVTQIAERVGQPLVLPAGSAAGVEPPDPEAQMAERLVVPLPPAAGAGLDPPPVAVEAPAARSPTPIAAAPPPPAPASASGPAGSRDVIAEVFAAMLAQSAAVMTLPLELRNGVDPRAADALPAPQAALPAAQPGDLLAVAGGREPVTVRFAHGSYALDTEAQSRLREVAERYDEFRGVIRVVGHASSRTRDMPLARHILVNFNISFDRAQAVAGELIRLGVPASALVVEAVGDTQPLLAEVMPAGEAANRRVEIFLGV